MPHKQTQFEIALESKYLTPIIKYVDQMDPKKNQIELLRVALDTPHEKISKRALEKLRTPKAFSDVPGKNNSEKLIVLLGINEEHGEKLLEKKSVVLNHLKKLVAPEKKDAFNALKKLRRYKHGDNVPHNIDYMKLSTFERHVYSIATTGEKRKTHGMELVRAHREKATRFSKRHSLHK